MNKRIEELVVESGNGQFYMGKFYPHIGSRTTQDWAKFAELIMQDFLSVCELKRVTNNAVWQPLKGSKIMTKKELKKLMQEFIASRDNWTHDEWYGTDQDYAKVILGDFATELGINLDSSTSN